MTLPPGEHKLISMHQVRVWSVLLESATWMTSQEIAEAAAVNSRTARKYCSQLSRLGVFEEMKVFPGYRYRLISKPSAAMAVGHIERLIRAETAIHP